MAVIEVANLITGAAVPVFSVAGAPVAGTDEIQTLTIGGTPTGGTLRLAYDGFTTGDISWNATNATLIANVDTALELLPNIGTGGVTTAVATMTAGIGTATITFAGTAVSKRAVNTITVQNNSMTGTAPTAAVAETTPGVGGTALGAPKGARLDDTTNGIAYINTGTTTAPTWTKVGTQT